MKNKRTTGVRRYRDKDVEEARRAGVGNDGDVVSLSQARDTSFTVRRVTHDELETLFVTHVVKNIDPAFDLHVSKDRRTKTSSQRYDCRVTSVVDEAPRFLLRRQILL
jgi:hypothetical protein